MSALGSAKPKGRIAPPAGVRSPFYRSTALAGGFVGATNVDAEMKRKFLGVWIPASIWLDRSLSITEKVMLVEINSLESSDRGCFASNDYFSEFFDLSKSRVSEIISNLSAKGLVRIELLREGKQIVGRQIWMTENGLLLTASTPSSENTHTPLRKTRIPPPSEKTATPFGKDGDPSSEKAIESNTDSNNTKSIKPSSPDKSGSQNSDVPDWIASEAWEGFVAMRARIRRPLTPYAMKLAVKSLEKLRDEGQDPNACLDQSTLNSWQSIHPVKSHEPARKNEKFDPLAYVNRNRPNGGNGHEIVIESEKRN